MREPRPRSPKNSPTSRQKAPTRSSSPPFPSLDGEEIEPYANRLFRFWKLGQAKENNGVLLLVAPNDRKMRIEVGYGLEGTLTDLHTKLIIENDMVPAFRAGDFSGGIAKAVDDMVMVLEGNPEELEARGERNQQPPIEHRRSVLHRVHRHLGNHFFGSHGGLHPAADLRQEARRRPLSLAGHDLRAGTGGHRAAAGLRAAAVVVGFKRRWRLFRRRRVVRRRRLLGKLVTR